MTDIPPMRVGFISGYGRSGTTLLNSVIGQEQGIVAVGELRHIWERGYSGNELCGCGMPFLECEFWHEASVAAFGPNYREVAARMRQLQRLVDRARYIPFMLAPHQVGWYRRRWAQYTDSLKALLAAIRRIAGADVIVDSSKDPSHGFLLSSISDLDIRLVHVVRDSRAVAYSWSRLRRRTEIASEVRFMPQYSGFRSAIEWMEYNLGAELLAMRVTGTIRIRYEDMTRQLRSTLAQILHVLGIERTPGDHIDEAVVTLRPTHSVSGNPSRFRTGRVPVAVDANWIRAMPRSAYRTVTAVTVPLLWYYGYPVSRRAAEASASRT